jgi:hypothetical protein
MLSILIGDSVNSNWCGGMETQLGGVEVGCVLVVTLSSHIPPLHPQVSALCRLVLPTHPTNLNMAAKHTESKY